MLVCYHGCMAGLRRLAPDANKPMCPAPQLPPASTRRRDFKHIELDPYDPGSPENITPASEAEVATGLAELRAQQASRLQAFISRERHAWDSEKAGVIGHYRSVLSELQQEEQQAVSQARSRSSQCPVCLETKPSRLVLVLTCGHPLCSDCAEKCADSGHSRCPTCRYPHQLDPKSLAERSEEMRLQYGSWRAGRARGASGDAASICDPPRDHVVALPSLPPLRATPLPLGNQTQELAAKQRMGATPYDKVAHRIITHEMAGDVTLAQMRRVPQSAPSPCHDSSCQGAA